MVSALAALAALLAAAAPAGTPDSARAATDSAGGPRVVRRFPAIEVRAPLHDLRSSQTVHVLPGAALAALPVDGLAEAIALQPGVVAEAGELHVRGGRAGETVQVLDGLCLSEPLRRRGMEVPVLALAGADLVSGAPDARWGSGLAGVLDLRSLAPPARPALAWRWTTDGGRDTRYDRATARLATPVGVHGLGLVLAADGTFDDGALPALRTPRRDALLGLDLGWRAENRVSAFARLAPVRDPSRFSAEVLASREVRAPYDPLWSLDGWVRPPSNDKEIPQWSAVEQPGFVRYRAADHLAMTDERRLAAQVAVTSRPGPQRATLALGWLHARSATGVGGDRGTQAVPRFGEPGMADPFHVLWGDDPLQRASRSDVLTLRGEGEWVTPTASSRVGLALSHEQVWLREVETLWTGWFVDQGIPAADPVREYRARAPGAAAWAQTRWSTGGMVMNAGLRGEAWTPGREATRQTLPGSDDWIVTLSPRLGIAYPVSIRDVLSIAYQRTHQAPGRDFLYDRRTLVSNRQPLGNPALRPATVISYEGALKHLFSDDWAAQVSIFYRDVYGQVGAREVRSPEGTVNLVYEDQDDGHALGWEWSLVRGRDEGTHLALSYTWLQAWGNESRPEGDPYGTLRGGTVVPTDDTPLSWDRRHSLAFAGALRWWWRGSLAWSSTLGSGLPWTPKPRRALVTDAGATHTRRLGWTECTNVELRWAPPDWGGLGIGLEARNLFDNRAEQRVGVDGYPNPRVNTLYDDYAAYRTETGEAGGAYWVDDASGGGHWVPVRDARLFQAPRTLRLSVGASW